MKHLPSQVCDYMKEDQDKEMTEEEWSSFLDQVLCKIGLHHYNIEKINYEKKQQLEKCMYCSKWRLKKYKN